MLDSPTRLFGTDGIRGVANHWPLTPQFITRIGWATARSLGREAGRPLALIGRDTRVSGSMIENAIAAGLLSQGFDTLHVGVLTTPGIAFLTRALDARCGISISASHNPFQDNGIKIFGADGFKIPDRVEQEIEACALAAGDPEPSAAPSSLGSRSDDAEPVERYVRFLLQAVSGRCILQGRRVVVDCNNGATCKLAPRVLGELGAEVVCLNDRPDGVNINKGYDPLEPMRLRETVLRERADWGVQLDGDGDRAVFVDKVGCYVDGDFVLAILAQELANQGRLPSRVVVSTVMANIGLERALGEMGLSLERTPVGDRWVAERMRAIGSPLGGEQSGHIVLLDGGHTTGDGLYTAIRLAQVIERKGTTLSALAGAMTKHPQVLVNVRVSSKPPLDRFPQIQSQLARSRAALGENARILLRYSGTENLARVMVEGLDAVLIAREANAIADIIRQTLA